MSDAKKPDAVEQTQPTAPITMSEALRLYKERQERAYAQAQKRMPELRVCLRLAAVVRLEVEYDGCGDEGQLERITCFDEQDKEVSINGHPKLEEAVQDFFYDVLECRYGGWENNEGAYGTFGWNLREDTLHHEHNARFTDVHTEEHDGL